MEIFLTSDQHYSQKSLLTMTRDNGDRLRDFDTIEEHDQTLIDNFNRVVSQKDKTYHLGDFCSSKKILDIIMPQLNGTHILILGNHDKLPKLNYLKYFKDIRAYHRLDNFVLSHVPVHPDSIHGKIKGNICGHIHYRSMIDPKYFIVCVEHHDYCPINFEGIKQEYVKRGII